VPARSLTKPAMKNSVAVTRPWATICSTAPSMASSRARAEMSEAAAAATPMTT
jgi:hypothetical protein